MTEEQKNRLDQLFDSARSQEPKVSYDQVSKRLIPALAVGVFVGLFAKWAAYSLKTKVIIMLSSVSLLGSVAVYTVMQLNAPTQPTQKEKAIAVAEPTVVEVSIQDENGVIETFTYEDDELVASSVMDTLSSEASTLVAVPTIPKGSEVTSSSQKLTQKSEHVDDRGYIHKTPENLEDSLSKQVFSINEKTSDEDLKRIKQIASEAGVVMKYTSTRRRGTIKKIQLELQLSKGESDNQENSTINSTVKTNKTFEYYFGWEEDANGKATTFLHGIDKGTGGNFNGTFQNFHIQL